MELSAEIIKEMGQMVHNEAAMTKLLNYIKRLSRQLREEEEKREFEDMLKKSLSEVRLHQQNKLKLKTVDEFIDSI